MSTSSVIVYKTETFKNYTQIEKEQLVSRYVSNNCPFDIPLDLIKLCLVYFECVFYWNVTGDDLQKFKTIKHGEAIACNQSFYYNDIKIIMRARPKGVKHKGFVLWGAVLDIPSNILTINANIELIFNNEQMDKYNIIFNKEHYRAACAPKQIASVECDEFDKLLFGCYMEINDIKYKDIKRKYILPIMCKINKIIKYEWKISKELLNRFKTSEWGQCFDSAIFGINDNWNFKCFPNGMYESEIGDLAFGINLLRLPINIKKIVFECSLICNFKSAERRSICWEREDHFEPNTETMSAIYWDLETFKTEWLNDLKFITFSGLITILKVYDCDNKEIEQSEWKKCGIV